MGDMWWWHQTMSQFLGFYVLVILAWAPDMAGYVPTQWAYTWLPEIVLITGIMGSAPVSVKWRAFLPLKWHLLCFSLSYLMYFLFLSLGLFLYWNKLIKMKWNGHIPVVWHESRLDVDSPINQKTFSQHFSNIARNIVKRCHNVDLSTLKNVVTTLRSIKSCQNVVKTL